MLLVALGLNVNRFWVDTPAKLPTTMESVAIRAVLSSACSEGEGQRFVIGATPEPLLEPALETYRLGDRMPLLVKWDALQPVVSARSSDVVCTVVMGETKERERIGAVLQQIWPDKTLELVHDRSGKVTVTLIHSTTPQALQPPK